MLTPMASSPLLPPSRRRRRLLLVVAAAAVILLSDLFFVDAQSCPFSSASLDSDILDHHHCDHHHHHHHHRHHEHLDSEMGRRRRLPEELAEEEDLELEGGHHHDHHHHRHHPHDQEMDVELSPLRIWMQAMGCSLLVSMASLVCLIMLPVFFLQGKPSKTLVDCLAVFGAGAMLGDAFLHQLPHAFGGGHSHSHDHDISELHDHHDGHGHSHSHSLEDLSVGLSVLSGIVLFLLVEKVVRYVEDVSGKGHGHHHHHHHHKGHRKADEGGGDCDKTSSVDSKTKDSGELDIGSGKKHAHGALDDVANDEKHAVHETHLRKRATSINGADDEGQVLNAGDGSVMEKLTVKENGPSPLASSLVFGYLNLFSDGVHNFTDGMALGSAFLLYGSVGGWSRTLFLLAHELPQEVGDFGILVRSGFPVSKALFFNFLSALVALAGTALALILGKDPGQSSLIEGFTAGGFIYIAVAGVLPEMNSGNTRFKSTLVQLTSLVLGMTVALCISLVE